MIPLTRPFLPEAAEAYVLDALRRDQRSGPGEYSQRAEEALRAHLGSPAAVLLVPSASAALELSLLVADIGPGDEVIVPTYTFAAAANAALLRGATPRFADVDPIGLGADIESVKRLINHRTKAVVAAPYGGIAGTIVPIASLCAEHGIALIEDEANGVLAVDGDRALGTIGAYGALSFHDTKVVAAGEGGALIVDDAAAVLEARAARDKGTNRDAFLAGQVERYTWVRTGSSWVVSELTAALILAGVEAIPALRQRMSALSAQYEERLGPWCEESGFRIVGAGTAWRSIATLVAPDAKSAFGMRAYLNVHDVASAFHYVPLHSSPAGLRSAPGDHCPVADDLWNRVVRIPFFVDLDESQIDRVLSVITAWSSP